MKKFNERLEKDVIRIEKLNFDLENHFEKNKKELKMLEEKLITEIKELKKENNELNFRIYKQQSAVKTQVEKNKVSYEKKLKKYND